MKTIKVYGQLKKFLGQSTFNFDVCTASEAIKALCANFKGLEKWLIDNDQNGIAYKVKVGTEEIGEDNITDLALPLGSKEIFSIRPVITGAGRGFQRILTGALLIGAGFLVGGGFLGGALAKNLGAIKFMKQYGLIMSLTGVVEMLSPQPDIPNLEQANQLQNFSFSGINNVNQVGTPIPIVMGRSFCGSAIISAGLDVDQVV
nr:Phage-related protein, tail component (COG4723) [uncultured Mediterranean phage uvMED]BAR26588.1 Phage-related protein, tail component (COG4723) [uncultured Mediterranean phage uvMED]BAR26617.1 Phage-related protein, tail component (COG4723) [uncultured Mediterranean phage uvMED]BAR26671.1 Phage-related protein, tail component (COG4723) [uncultured Mediterranean phage uvMED]BAR26741.1 Phage-related protein, tail component (COG4723) [uncultured Mediterranean phage uvMED]|tara:strand:+ start:2096 stop:2704 length:609 start_codon:yes stop_codon:yes gene_type:complete